jgi:quercetin dioxygenase-like cupin family protein
MLDPAATVIQEGTKENMNRRSALALGLAATSAVVMTKSAAAQPYAATEGKELSAGVRQVDLGKRQSMVPGYKNVSMRDIVFQANSKISNPSMENDMVCHCAEGELRIKQGPGMEFMVKKGDVWSCNKGLPEDTENIGSGVSIMRVIDLLTT